MLYDYYLHACVMVDNLTKIRAQVFTLSHFQIIQEMELVLQKELTGMLSYFRCSWEKWMQAIDVYAKKCGKKAVMATLKDRPCDGGKSLPINAMMPSVHAHL